VPSKVWPGRTQLDVPKRPGSLNRFGNGHDAIGSRTEPPPDAFELAPAESPIPNSVRIDKVAARMLFSVLSAENGTTWSDPVGDRRPGNRRNATSNAQILHGGSAAHAFTGSRQTGGLRLVAAESWGGCDRLRTPISTQRHDDVRLGHAREPSEVSHHVTFTWLGLERSGEGSRAEKLLGESRPRRTPIRARYRRLYEINCIYPPLLTGAHRGGGRIGGCLTTSALTKC